MFPPLIKQKALRALQCLLARPSPERAGCARSEVEFEGRDISYPRLPRAARSAVLAAKRNIGRPLESTLTERGAEPLSVLKACNKQEEGKRRRPLAFPTRRLGRSSNPFTGEESADKVSQNHFLQVRK